MKIGFLIADEHEFAPLVRQAADKGREISCVCGEKAICMQVKNAEIVAILSGVGKVNATAAACELYFKHHVDIILNFGLSGAVSGAAKGTIVAGSSYVEHDFDLTPLGFKPAERISGISEYKADVELLKLFCSYDKRIKTGVLACGDQFIADKTKKEWLHEQFGAICCDMESAAIASFCKQTGIRFLSIRSVSDDADELAAEVYRENNFKEEDILAKIALWGAEKLGE